MALNITPVTNHREREKGNIIYPVYSRRAEGLSIGINLYPDKKNCLFNCTYCEVFPFSNSTSFSLELMKEGLQDVIDSAQKQNIPIKDICFSGNGEPTLSPSFPDALRLAENIRTKMTASSQLVIITNGTGLLQPQVFSLLKEAASIQTTNIWLKLDAGTQQWYKKMNRSSVPFDKLIEKIKEFASCSPVTIQTMLCAINGKNQPETDTHAWEDLVCELVNPVRSKSVCTSAIIGVRKVQLYGKARPAPEDPLASAVPDEYIEKRAASLRRLFAKKGIIIPVEVYI